MESAPKKRILILGGGFAGLTVAMELDKKLAQDPSVEITLVNRENFFLFTPMLHEVATSDLDITTIVNPARKMLRRVRFLAGNVERVDIERHKVAVSHGFDQHQHALGFDSLVLGLGSVTNLYGIPGLREYALTMKTLGDAMRLRNHLVAHLEEAESDCCNVKPLLTFVVAGGGFAGVETVAGINDFVRGTLSSYPNLTEDMLRIVLVHAGPFILPELDNKLGAYAQRKLAEREVEVRLNAKVKEFSGRRVLLSDGTTIDTNTLVWTAGTSPNPLLETIPCAKEHGRLLVTESLELQAWPGVWALGDCSAVPDRQRGGFHPPTAQHALRQGKIVAHNVIAAIRGTKKKRFNFSTIAQLAAIGRRTGVANILGINFSGFFAWWLWRTIYLSKLPRFEKKLRVAFDWTLDLIFSKDFAQFLDIRAPMVSRPEEAGRHDNLESESHSTLRARPQESDSSLTAMPHADC
ncbi:MAG TPA: NAD(P)/FAD-dependent oxidoreductase [Candidatus Acidoferrum sp.]|jgi:NADH dehydrogenase|nr:NAD(P)/FAD-dependent oxidoreductase [Candidatus Acidoferrum sp.]